MAGRTDRRVLAGIVALSAVTLLIGGAFLGLLVEGARDQNGALSAFDPYLLRIARFTLWQAALSTLLSVVPAIFVARSLSRHPRLPGRALILRLFALPLALPAIVVALGLLELFGRAGYLAGALSAISSGRWPGIYGLSGILVAHAFFNLPLAARFFLEALNTVGNDQWRLAAQLGMRPRSVFCFIEWPVLRAALPATAGLVFMLCVTSFTIVLTLGGGPRATTLEVAIYQALRFDFDPARAAALTSVQIVLTLAVIFMFARLGGDIAGEANLDVTGDRPVTARRLPDLVDAATIGLALAFVACPILATIASGLQADLVRLAGEASVQRAFLTSIAFAGLSAALAVGMTIAFSAARSGGPPALRTLVDSGISYVLVVPPIVIGAGWFILLRNTTDVFLLAPVMVVAVNAVMAVPFALRAIRPTYDASATRHDRLCTLLGMHGWTRLRLVECPVLRRPVLVAAAFSAALSLGDLGVVALFGSESVQTLPYLLLSRMGSYRTQDAAGLALLLGALCLALVTIADWASRSSDR